MQPQSQVPRALPVSGLISAGGPGFMFLAKEMGWTIPFPIILMIGTGSIIALAVSAILSIVWAWRWLREQRDPNSTFNAIRIAARRNVIPIVLAAVAVVGLLLIVVAGVGAYYHFSDQSKQAGPLLPSSTTASTPDETRIRLQFGAANTLPTAVEVENIWRWYALQQIVGLLGPNERHEVRTWTLFLTLDKPFNANQILVESNEALPQYEVKDRDPRSVVIAFMGEMPPNVLVEVRLLSKTGDVKPHLVQRAAPSIAGPPPIPEKPKVPTGNPLQDAIDTFLAKQGKQANYTPFAAGTVMMQDDSDGTGPYIAKWNMDVLGSWPTVADGFSPQQLRRAAPPIITTAAYDVPKKLAAIDGFMDLLKGDFTKVLIESRAVQQNWKAQIQTTENRIAFMQKVAAMRATLEGARIAVNAIEQNNRHFDDIVALVDQTYVGPYFGRLDRFSGAIGSVGDPPYKMDLDFFVKPIADEFRGGIDTLSNWHDRKLAQAIEIRKRLSR